MPRSPRARSAACRSRQTRCSNATVTAQSQAPDARAIPRTSSSRPTRAARRCISATSPGSSSAPKITASSPASTAIPARASRSRSRPGADALETAELVKARDRGSCRTNFPDGIQYAYAYDTTDFIKLSVAGSRENAARGDRPRRPRDLRLPAELARAAGAGDRHSGRAARHVRGVLHRRLHDQHA